MQDNKCITLNYKDTNRLANSIIRGENIVFKGGRGNGKSTLSLKTLYKTHLKLSKMKSKIKTPYAFVLNPETLEKLKQQCHQLTPSIDIPIFERFCGISVYKSAKIPKGICRVVWSYEELRELLESEEQE